MTFDQYVADINKLAEAAGGTEPGEPYFEAGIWLDAFNAGLTPAEAWEEEELAAMSMLG